MSLRLVIISLILFSFASTKLNAFDIREVNNAKVMSKASYAVNDTNLVDEENAENLLKNVTDLSEALKEKIEQTA